MLTRSLVDASYESLKKSELENALDEFIYQHRSRFSNRSDLTGYFNSRSRAQGSPVKKEKESLKDEAEKALKVTKRRLTKGGDESECVAPCWPSCPPSSSCFPG